VKIILNVSVDPHFVALFDATDNLVDQVSWTDFKTGSQRVWDFLEHHKIETLSFIGGISGPGGFSTLRVGGAIINALSLKFGIPVHQARADQVTQALIDSDNFVLNSFGNGVFIGKNNDLKRIEIEEAVEIFQQNPVFIDFLPEHKRALFTPLKTDKDLVKTTLEVLKTHTPRKVFLPDYEFPAVAL